MATKKQPGLCRCGCGQALPDKCGNRRQYINQAHKQADYRKRRAEQLSEQSPISPKYRNQ